MRPQNMAADTPYDLQERIKHIFLQRVQGKDTQKWTAAQYFSCLISDCPATEQTLHSLTLLVPSIEVASKPNDASEDSVLLREQVPSHIEFSNDSGLIQFSNDSVTKKTQELCEIEVNTSWKFVLTETESD